MKKLILLTLNFLILIIILTATSCNRESKITGTVTYFFNDNFGQKPDVGAEIYFLEKGDQDLFDFTLKWSSKISPNHLANRNKIAQWELDKLRNKMSEISFADSVYAIQNSEEIERRNAISYFKSLMKNDKLKCTANGNGEFSINLPSGRYYVLVVFSHRDAIDVSFTAEDLESDSQLNYKFEKIDMDM